MKHAFVRTAIPYPLIWDKGRFAVRVQGQVFQVDFERRYRQQDGKFKSPGIAQTQCVELRYDRLARIAHTAIEILFPHLVEDRQELLGWIRLVLNRLIQVYRFTTGEFFLETVPQNEMWPCDIGVVQEDGTLSCDFKHIVDFGYGLTIARIAPIPELAQQYFLSEAELPISRMLFLNALREELLENFRLAIVEAETAFESLVPEVISQYYRGQGVVESEIQSILDARLKKLLKDHLPKCCGESFVGTPGGNIWLGRMTSIIFAMQLFIKVHQ